MKRVLSPACALIGILSAFRLSAADFHVAPAGSPSGNGSRDRPWDLATALNQATLVKSGDTIWIHAGTYVGHFVSSLLANGNRPIIVRAAPGERAILDGNYGGNEVTLTIKGANTWFWGLEITNSDPGRSSADGNNPARRGEGVNLFGTGNKLVNTIIHDTAQGVLSPSGELGAEIYGCLIYYNGYDAPDRGHGHGIYVQNDAGPKRILDNIIFSQYGYGIHAYTEGSKLNDLDFEGNTSFNNGNLSAVSGLTMNILVGASGSAATGPADSAKVAKNTVLLDNYAYFSESGGTTANLGYSKGIASPKIDRNYLVGTTALALVNAFRPIDMSGNTFIGSLTGFTSSEFPGNTYLTSHPTGVKVFIRPNRYESGRANVTIYNWDRAAAADVDPRGILAPGSSFELRSAQNFFGPPVLEGKYDGTPLRVPMANLSAAVPVGRGAPSATGPEFQAFILLPKATSPVARMHFRPPHDPRPPLVVSRLEQSLAGRPQALGPDAEPTSAAEGSWYFPDFARTSSDAGATRRAGVMVANLDEAPATVALRFLEHDRDNLAPREASFVLNTGESFESDDALAEVFAVEDSFGALEVEAFGRIHVAVFERARSDPGEAPVIARRIGAVSRGDLSAVRSLPEVVGPSLRSDIAILNPNPAGAAVAVTLLLSPATVLTTTFVVVPPRGYVRRELASLFPGLAVSPGESFSVAVDGGSVPIFAFAPAEASTTPPPIRTGLR